MDSKKKKKKKLQCWNKLSKVNNILSTKLKLTWKLSIVVVVSDLAGEVIGVDDKESSVVVLLLSAALLLSIEVGLCKEDVGLTGKEVAGLTDCSWLEVVAVVMADKFFLRSSNGDDEILVLDEKDCEAVEDGAEVEVDKGSVDVSDVDVVTTGDETCLRTRTFPTLPGWTLRRWDSSSSRLFSPCKQNGHWNSFSWWPCICCK